ncbi:hypothetical protein COOONC_08963 [Cooperia oncophora]
MWSFAVMDRQRKSRRSSILKIRQTEVVSEKVTVEDDTAKQVMKRRVSFHNVKTVQNFEKDNLNLLDGSPFREKIQETMSSDGILTYVAFDFPVVLKFPHVSVRRWCSAEGPPRIPRLDFDDVTKYTAADMSICDTTVRQDVPSPVDMSLCQTTCEQPESSRPSGSQSDRTQYSCVDMSFSTTATGGDSMADMSRRTSNDTFACLNIQPGQSIPGLQTPRWTQSTCDKSSISTFDDDTALVFEKGNALSNGKQEPQQCNTVFNTSSFMSECTDAGDTMRVFDCLMPNVGAGDMAEHDRSRERTAMAMV